METCSSLEVLKIEQCTLSSDLPNCPSLRHLKVRSNALPTISSNVNMLKWFETQSKSLESLELDNSLKEFYSAWMDTNEFPALKQLYYKGSGRTKWPNCPKLKFLRLEHHPDNIETFDWISRHAETLESLDLSVNDNFKSSDWPYLPHLRSVCLRLPLGHRLDFAYEWISKQSKTLYRLEVRDKLNVVDICQLISLCKKVRTLSISWHMGLFDASWISFFETLKKNKVSLDEPFIVKIYNFWSYINVVCMSCILIGDLELILFNLLYFLQNPKWRFLQKVFFLIHN